VALTVKDMLSFLPDCLGALLPELAPDGELVVVDGGSTDGSAEYLRGLEAEGRLRLLVTPCTTGKGRHLAVLASGAPVVVTQVDADLKLRPGVLRRALETLEHDPRHPVLVVVGRKDENPDSTKLYLWRREAYLASGGYPDLRIGEDLQVLQEPIRRGWVGHLTLPRVGDDLRAAQRSPGAVARPWSKGPALYEAALRRFRAGWTLRDYLGYLRAVRRGSVRYLAGVALTFAAAARFRLGPRSGPARGAGAPPGRISPPPR
jgi:glycosyltransferase involved in cell wall biosynthesis